MSKTVIVAGIIGLIGIFAISGCDIQEPTQGGSVHIHGDIATIEYDGHWFVVFDKVHGYAGAGGICHHPDCPKCLTTSRSE